MNSLYDGSMSGWINLGFPQLIFRARLSVERAKRGEWAGYEAVIFSTIAAAAFLNDLAEMSLFLSEPEEPKEISAMRNAILEMEKQRAGVRRKYRASYAALLKQDLPIDEPWWRDYTLLVDLRNELVHSKVDVVSD
jgi:hypothetical protein